MGSELADGDGIVPLGSGFPEAGANLLKAGMTTGIYVVVYSMCTRMQKWFKSDTITQKFKVTFGLARGPEVTITACAATIVLEYSRNTMVMSCI